MNIPALRAEEQYEEYRKGNLRIDTPDVLYDIVFAATGDKRLAEAEHYALTSALNKQGG